MNELSIENVRLQVYLCRISACVTPAGSWSSFTTGKYDVFITYIFALLFDFIKNLKILISVDGSISFMSAKNCSVGFIY